jgi:hypothetical protein
MKFSRMVIRSCRPLNLSSLSTLSMLVVFVWTISFLALITSHVYLYVDELVGHIVLTTPVTIPSHPLAQTLLM